MNIEQIIAVFREVIAHDTLHDSIAEDIQDTRMNKSDGPRACDMPGMGFHYVLDTKHYTLPELARIAATYRRQLDTLDALVKNNPEAEAELRTWNILEHVTGSDSLTAPPGVAVVTHDTIDSYGYTPISEYAQHYPVHTIA